MVRELAYINGAAIQMYATPARPSNILHCSAEATTCEPLLATPDKVNAVCVHPRFVSCMHIARYSTYTHICSTAHYHCQVMDSLTATNTHENEVTAAQLSEQAATIAAQ